MVKNKDKSIVYSAHSYVQTIQNLQKKAHARMVATRDVIEEGTHLNGKETTKVIEDGARSNGKESSY